MQSINIQYQYAGKTVKNRKLIDGFVMYTEDNIFEYIPSAPVEIYDSGKIVIDVKWYLMNINIIIIYFIKELPIRILLFCLKLHCINMLKIAIRVLLIALALSQYTVVKEDIGSTYIKLDLRYTGQGDYYVKPKSTIVKDLVFHFKALTYN